MELNLSREDAALLRLFDLSSVVSDDWTMMTKNICVSVLSTSRVSYTSGRHSAAVAPLPDRVFKMSVDVYVVGALCVMGLDGTWSELCVSWFLMVRGRSAVSRGS